MKRSTLVALAVLVFVLASYVVWVDRRQVSTDQLRRRQSLVVQAFDRDDIKHVEIFRDGHMILQRQESEPEIWRNPNDSHMRISSLPIEALLQTLDSLAVTRPLRVQGMDLRVLRGGPLLVLQGSQTNIRLHLVRTNGNAFLWVQGEQRMHPLEVEMVSVLFPPLSSFRDRRVGAALPLELPASIEWSSPLNASEGAWKIHGQNSHFRDSQNRLVDRGQLRTLLSHLRYLEVQSFLPTASSGLIVAKLEAIWSSAHLVLEVREDLRCSSRQGFRWFFGEQTEDFCTNVSTNELAALLARDTRAIPFVESEVEEISWSCRDQNAQLILEGNERRWNSLGNAPFGVDAFRDFLESSSNAAVPTSLELGSTTAEMTIVEMEGQRWHLQLERREQHLLLRRSAEGDDAVENLSIENPVPWFTFFSCLDASATPVSLQSP